MRAIGISTKVFLAFACIVTVFGAVLGYGVYRLHQVQLDTRLIHHCYVPLSLSLSEAHTDLATYDAVLSERDKAVLRRVVQAQKVVYPFARRVRANLARAQEFVESGLEMVGGTSSSASFLAEGRDALIGLDGQLDAFERDSAAFRQSVLREDWSEGFERQQQLRRTATELQRQLRELSRATRAEIGDAIGRAEASEREALVGILVLTVVASLIALLAMFLVHRTLRPIRELTHAARELGRGEYSGRVAVNRSDEVGKLAEEFNRMADNIEARDKALRERRDELERAYEHLVELRQQEERTKAELIKKERLAAVGRMTSKVTHELRNPLSSLGLTAEMLDEELDALGAGPDSEAKALLRAVVDEIDRLTEITEEYLAYARLPLARPQPTDLQALVEDLLRFLREEFAQRGIEVGAELGSDGGSVMADRNQLRRALLNLIRNAMEAMQGGGRLTVELRHEAGRMALSVGDSGPGIPADDLPRIFEPFYSTKDGGTGLGLPLTHQIIEEHGGRILVASTLGQGTVFRIELPSLTGSESTAPVAAVDDEPGDPAGGGSEDEQDHGVAHREL